MARSVAALLRAVRLRSPRQADVVVFDAAGADVLERTVLGGIAHAVLASRRENIHLSPRVLVHMWRLRSALGGAHGLSALYRLNLLACLHVMRPRVVVTFIDNSRQFQWLSLRYSGAAFVAIQNGTRYRYDLTDWVVSLPELGRTTSLSDFVCFGVADQDLFERYGAHVARYHPVGSVQASFYRAQAGRAADTGPQTDVCLVSQWERSCMIDGVYPEIARGVRELDERLARYVSECDVSLSIALRSTDPDEEAYFRNRYGSSAVIVRSNRAEFSTYCAMDRAEAVVSFCSTAAVEAFGWGAKVLFCNVSGDDNYDLAVDGPWSLVGGSYQDFAEALDRLRVMSGPEFEAVAVDARDYLMSSRHNEPAHLYARRLVLESAGLSE